MSVKSQKTVKAMKEAIRYADVKKPKPYDAIATVVRIDGNTAWVHFDGGAEETPVRKTINAKTGDVVQVRVGGGDAWIVGNDTAPPTDDTTANVANTNAKKANKTAVTAVNLAELANAVATRAQTSADGKNTIYYGNTTPTDGNEGDTWFNGGEDNAIYIYQNGSWVKQELGEDAIANLSITNAKIADGTIQDAKIGNLDGGKITAGSISANKIDINGLITVGELATDAEVLVVHNEATDARKYADNYLTAISGTTGISVHSLNDTSNYVNITSNAVNVVTGGTNVAQFGASARIGKANGARLMLSDSGVDFYGIASGTTAVNMAHIGYDSNQYLHFTFGTRTSATSNIGQFSCAIGDNNMAKGDWSFAQGKDSSASGTYSSALGDSTAVGNYSFAVNNSRADGTGAHSQNSGRANGNYSSAEGISTIANGIGQHVQGKYNVADTTSAFIIGNGANDSSRSNALTVDWSGNVNIPSGADYKINGTGINAKFANYLPLSGGTLTGQLYSTSDINVTRGKSFRTETATSGSYVTLLALNNSDNIVLGNSSYPLQVYGNGAYLPSTIIKAGYTLKFLCNGVNSETTGGWARALLNWYTDDNQTKLAHLGIYGGAGGSFSYMYIGNGDYNEANFRVYASGACAVPNTIPYYGLNASGTARDMMRINSSNTYVYGYGSYYNNEGGSIFEGNSVAIQSKGGVTITATGGITLNDPDTTTYTYVKNLFYVGTYSESVTIGANTYKATADKAISAPVGYNPVGVVGWSTTNNNISVFSGYVKNSSTLTIGYRNASSNSVTATVTTRILFLKATGKYEQALN